jgi:predicted nucleic acid-binding protein
MSFEAAISARRRLGLDTSPLIYLVEKHADFGPWLRRMVERAEASQLGLLTSVLTVTEVLTKPLALGQLDLAQRYQEVLFDSVGLRIVPIDAEIAKVAARLRAEYQVKTPDAIQLAAAIRYGCDAFVTNDGNLARVRDIEVLVLKKFLPLLDE